MPTTTNHYLRLYGGGNLLLYGGGKLLLYRHDIDIGGPAILTASGTLNTARAIPPPPPENLVAARSADRLSAALTWDAVSGATGYEVYRAADYRGQPILITTVTAVSYNDSGLDATVNYTYSVRAINATMSVNGRRTTARYTQRRNDVINP